MSSSRSRRSVQSGSCDGMNSFCALQKNDCPDGTGSYLPSRLLPTGTSHGGRCKQRDETEAESPLGTCLDDSNNSVCASHSSVCMDPNSFQSASHGNGCNMKRHETTAALTLFGYCGGDCFWSSTDCPQGETWTPQVGQCTCDQVRVGACLFEGFYWCAVSADACENTDEWISARDLRDSPEHHNAPECYLCRAVPTSAPIPTTVVTKPTMTPASPVVTNKPTMAPVATLAPVSSITASTSSSANSLVVTSDDGRNSVNITVGIIVSVLVVAVVGGSIVAFTRHQRLRKSAVNARKAAEATTRDDEVTLEEKIQQKSVMT